MQMSASLILLAIVTEQVTEILKQAVPGIRVTYSKLVSMAIGIVLCYSTKIGLLHELDVPIVYPLVDYVITGLLISKGSNFLHDLFSRFNTAILQRSR